MDLSPAPQTMTITGENTVTINDVLVGEVWLCGGQSNMEWLLADTADFDASLYNKDEIAVHSGARLIIERFP